MVSLVTEFAIFSCGLNSSNICHMVQPSFVL